MILYRATLTVRLLEKLRARVVKWVFRRLWVKGPYPKFWVLPGDAIGREILTQGLFEKTLLLGLKKLLTGRKGTLLDIGANIGNHTVFLAPLFKQVVAFEPNPAVFRILEANVELNGLKQVVTVNKGLGAKAAKLPFYQNTAGNLGASGFAKSGPSKVVGKLDIATGDAELQRLKVRTESISVVKIDVEGLEVEVIKGLQNTLKTAQPLVLFEVLDGQHGKGIWQALSRLDYRYFYELTETCGRCELKPLASLENRYYALILASVTKTD